jgi:hypothetical protein
VLSVFAPLSASGAASSIVPVGELRPGQRAVVHTVFQGTSVDTFLAEIVGVMRGGRAEGDLIVGRALSPRVIHTGIAQGMSGSPVYVDGKLAGALSSGWGFVKEPLFGITPIEEMLGVLAFPERGGPQQPSVGPEGPPAGARVGDAGSAGWGEFRWPGTETESATKASRDPQAGARPGSPGEPGLQRLALPLACSGLHPLALSMLRPLVEPWGLAAVPAGESPGGGPQAADLGPGSALAVDLLRGDLRLSAIGTVTWRDGDRLLAFGHPFFQAGDVNLPMSSAEIVTIIPSDFISFKLGSPGRQIGTLLQDRRAAVSGRLGPAPRLLPFTVAVEGVKPRPQQFRYQVVEDRTMAPTLIAVAALSSLFESGGAGANQSVRWKLQVHAAGLPTLRLADRVSSDGATGEAVGQLRAPLEFLFNNPYQRIRFDSLTAVIEVEPAREQWVLRNARLDRVEVKPGDQVEVLVEVERFRGARETHRLKLPVPAELGDGDVMVWVGGGAELMRYESSRTPARYQPVSLSDAWRRLSAWRSSDGIYAALAVRYPEVTAGGADLPELPASAQAVLLSPVRRGQEVRGGRLTLLSEIKRPVEGVLRGELQLPLSVNPEAP